MQMHRLSISARVSCPDRSTWPGWTKEATIPSMASGSWEIGTFTPLNSGPREIRLEITVTFDELNGLALSTPPKPQSASNTKKALKYSLDDPSFVDAKFYLFSAKSRGRLARPKPVFAKTALLVDGCNYLKNLLSIETGFTNGTPCNLRDYVTKEVAKLDPNGVEDDSDSDLEDEDELTEVASSSVNKGNAEAEEHAGKETKRAQDCRAFAINGTAYQTWKAFIFYTYTNEIGFNMLKSQQVTAESESMDPDLVSCSPKSMYRFADYADLPHLKSLAKDSIEERLSKSNIVYELFSSFTSKYQEIIELEVDYLVKNFTGEVGRAINETLQTIVLGTKPHCYRVLAFTLRRLLGDTAEEAWDMVGSSTAGAGIRVRGMTKAKLAPLHDGRVTGRFMSSGKWNIELIAGYADDEKNVSHEEPVKK